jgi:predicted amidohydrolase YtcJ
MTSALSDLREHLLEASRDMLLVPVDRACSITQFTAVVGVAARDLPPGAWIVTSMGWHESFLAENRLPTGAELDAAAPGHPVLARRGGHLAVASAAALAAAGIGRGTPDPPGGKIGRHEDGRPDGLLEGRAVYQVAAVARAPGRVGGRPVHDPHGILAEAATDGRSHIAGSSGVRSWPRRPVC